MPKLKSARLAELTVTVPAEVYERFSAKLMQNGTTFDDFVRIAMLGYSRMPTIFDVDDQITFGKYKGEKIGDLIRVTPDYIEYCVKKVQGFQLSEAAIELLDEVNNPDA